MCDNTDTELKLSIHEGLTNMQRDLLREKARLDQKIVRVDEMGHCYEQSARAALLEQYGETVPGINTTPHPEDTTVF